MPLPVAEYTLAAIALIVIGYVAIAALRRRNGRSKQSDPDLSVVVDNNTKAMEGNTKAVKDLAGMVGGLRDLVLQTTTKQGTQMEEVVAFVRGQRGGGGA